MTSRDLIRKIIKGEPITRTGFWLGNPHDDTLPIYNKYFGTTSLEQLHQKLGSDFRWLTPQYLSTTYRHPERKGLFDVWKFKQSLAEAGPLGNAETVTEVDEYEWPDISYLHFEEGLDVLKNTGDRLKDASEGADDFVAAEQAHLDGEIEVAADAPVAAAGDEVGRDFDGDRHVLLCRRQIDVALFDVERGLGIRHGRVDDLAGDLVLRHFAKLRGEPAEKRQSP